MNASKILTANKFQLISIFLVITYITILSVAEHKSQKFAEKIYPIQKVPDHVDMISSHVEVGLHINNFTKFSFDTNEFTMDALTWFRFPIGTESLSTIEKFDFQNGTILNKSAPIIKLINDDVLVTYQVKVDFKTYLKYKDFPLGDHRINIILDNKFVTPGELTFKSSNENFILSKDIQIATWTPINKYVNTGYIQSTLNEKNQNLSIVYPCTVFTVDFENASMRDLITLYFPMYVIFLICLFSLMLEITEHINRMVLIATSIPILVLFRSVILQLVPPMAETSKADFVYFLLVFLSLIILIFQAYLALIMQKIKEYSEEQQKNRLLSLQKANNLVFILVILLLVILVTYNSAFM
jgi:hypothetical protein